MQTVSTVSNANVNAWEMLSETLTPDQRQLVGEAFLELFRRGRGQLVAESRQHRLHSLFVGRYMLVPQQAPSGESDACTGQ